MSHSRAWGSQGQRSWHPQKEEQTEAHWVKIVSVGDNHAACRTTLVTALSCERDMLIDGKISNNLSQ